MASSFLRGLIMAAALGSLPLQAGEAPLFRDFVGLCGHTVGFKPALYAPVCRWVRDYHPMKWDLAGDTAVLPPWPEAKNRVSWEQVYGSWHAAGLHTSACLMFDEMGKDWKSMANDAGAYAKAFAQNFGPGGRWPFVECVELGNEPGQYSDPDYRMIFEAMAKGIRVGNPALKIATCNVEAKPSDRYWKGADSLQGLEGLYDVLQIHRYALAEGWPTWRRSYPEDPKVPYLSSVQDLLDWRDAHAATKPVWVTEFGWDTTTKKPDPKTEFAKWQPSSDEQQAQWIVRSYFLFARMGVAKSFLYFFNDKDEPKLHAGSGLTRNYQPKPAYYAVAWMLKSLANYRFSRAIKESLEDGYDYEFTPEKSGEPIVRALWHPTKTTQAVVNLDEGITMSGASRMPLSEGDDKTILSIKGMDGIYHVEIGERPLLIQLQSWGRKVDIQRK